MPIVFLSNKPDQARDLNAIAGRSFGVLGLDAAARKRFAHLWAVDAALIGAGVTAIAAEPEGGETLIRGFVVARLPAADGTCRVLRFCVDPAHRRRGIGFALWMGFQVNTGLAHGASRYVVPAPPQSTAFFARYDFQDLGPVADDDPDGPWPEGPWRLYAAGSANPLGGLLAGLT